MESLFEGTYLDNITFNDKDITQEDLKWALDGVQLGSFIKSYRLRFSYISRRKTIIIKCTKNSISPKHYHKPKIILQDPTDTMDEKLLMK
jgi:hypothetical protein